MSVTAVTRISAAAVAGAGLLLLGAYALGVTMPREWPPPWACVGTVAIGAALWFAIAGRMPGLVRVGAVAVIAIGVVSWGEAVSGRDLGVDALLFAQGLPAAALHPGRPAPTTGFNFVLLGVGLLLINRKERVLVLIREIFAVGSLTFCYLTLMTALIRSSRTPLPRETMSAITAGMLLTAAATLLFSRQDGYLLSLLRSSGPAGIFARWLMPVPLVLPVLTALARTAGQRLGLFDTRGSSSILSFVDILVAILLVWGSANQVLRLDKLRREAEDEVRKSRDDLEERVLLRTQELLAEVAERQRAERELQLTNATLANVIEASPLAICAFNIDGTVRTSNTAAEAIRVPEAAEFQAFFQRAATGEAIAGAECSLADRGLDLTVWAVPLLTPEGERDGVILMAVDVSERKAFERQLLQTQKLESLGVLAGGIAHDFNNLLTGVMGNASLLLEGLKPDVPERELLDQVVSASQRASDLTRQLLAYAGKGQFVLEEVDISALAREISGLIQTSIPRTVSLRLELMGNLPTIEADASQLQQVIMNLVINGAEAIVDTGTVVVSTGTQTLDERCIRQQLKAGDIAPGEYVTLQVTDTGTGMDEETMTRIFDPFFTTKFTGRGLGLAAVQGIVRGHNGALRVNSVVGQGTTFELFLPASGRKVAHPAPDDRMGKMARGTGTILVIDDESIVRQTARSTLERIGYGVEVAESGEEGVRIFAEGAGQIRAVLLDLTMPGLSGEETYARLKTINPEVRVILSTGFDESEVAAHFTGQRLAGFIQKPYTAQQLAAKVEGVVG